MAELCAYGKSHTVKDNNIYHSRIDCELDLGEIIWPGIRALFCQIIQGVPDHSVGPLDHSIGLWMIRYGIPMCNVQGLAHFLQWPTRKFGTIICGHVSRWAKVCNKWVPEGSSNRISLLGGHGSQCKVPSMVIYDTQDISTTIFPNTQVNEICRHSLQRLFYGLGYLHWYSTLATSTLLASVTGRNKRANLQVWQAETKERTLLSILGKQNIPRKFL